MCHIIKKYIYDESLFRILYSVSMMLSFVSVIELPFQILSYMMMLWALFLLINKVKTAKLAHMKYAKLFILFLCSMLLTTFLNIRDNFFMNLLMVYHVAICFFMFYALHCETNRAKIRKEMLIFCSVIIRISTILSFVGIIITLFWPRLSFFGYGLGLMGNRYNGLYTNPNLSAFVSVISIICCHIIFNYNLSHRRTVETEKVIADRLLFFCFFVNFMALLLSDSNASLLFLLLYMCMFLLCYNLKINYKRSLKVKLINLLWVLLLCSAFCISIILMRIGVQYSIAELMNNIHSVEYVPSTSGTDVLDDMVITIGRSTTEYEVSSGRLDAWGKAISLYVYNPIFGIGKENIVSFGEYYLPRGFSYSDLHNAYLNILVSYGLVGFILFLIISICVCKYIISLLKKYILAGKGNELIILFSAVSAYCAYSFFEKALLLDITFIVVCFWLFLGYTMSYVTNFSVKTNNRKKEINLKKQTANV